MGEPEAGPIKTGPMSQKLFGLPAIRPRRTKPRGFISLRLRLVAGILLLAATTILLLGLAGHLLPDNHLLIIILIILLAALLSALALIAFTQPLTRLTKVAERIALGDLWSQIPETGDEFGILARALNTMITELRRNQAGMEATIAQQTAELAAASEQIKKRDNQFHAINEVTRTIAGGGDAVTSGGEASFHDPDDLLYRVTELISRSFGFYYVGLYLLDKTGEWAVLQATNRKDGEDGNESGSSSKDSAWKPSVAIRDEVADGSATDGDAKDWQRQPMPVPGYRLNIKATDLIGEAIRCGEPRTAVRSDRYWLPGDNPRAEDGDAPVSAEPDLAQALKTAETAAPHLPYARSAIVLPLKSGARVIGAIDIQTMERLALQEEDLTILGTLASQVAIAIENARLVQEYSYSLAEIQILHRQTLQEAWTRVVKEGKRSGYIYQNGKLTPLAGDPNEQTRGDLTYSDNRPDETPGEHGGPAPGASLTVPITVRGQTIAMLDLGETLQGRRWTEEEINLVETVADQVGLAMENARLLEETQRRAEREHLVSEITTRLRESNDPDVILQIAARELRTALHAAQAQILLPPEKQVVDTQIVEASEEQTVPQTTIASQMIKAKSLRKTGTGDGV